MDKVARTLKYRPWAQWLFFAATLRRDFPHSLNIEVTNCCNLNCVMCPRAKSNRQVGMIDPDLYQQIINELKRSGRKLWTLTLIKDGEPLLHPQLDRLIKLAAEARVARRIEIFTNGTLLSKQNWSRRLLTSGLDILNVSLDAATPETYRKIRRSREFQQVVTNVRRLVALKREIKTPTKIIIRTVAMAVNQAEIPLIKAMWQGMADGVEVTPFANYGGGISGNLGIHQANRLDKDDRADREKKRWPCLVLWYNPVINWDGKVTTCCANYLDNELIVGDIRRRSLADIWQSEKYRQLRRDHLSANLKSWPTCAKCTYWRKFADHSFLLKRIS